MNPHVTRVRTATLTLAGLALVARMAAAQAPPAEPPQTWSGNVSAGFTVTSGNTDVQQYNVGLEAGIKPSDRSTAKFTSLFLRGTNSGQLNVNRTGAEAREEYRLNGRTFVFAQVDYLRDEFKHIDYLLSPLAGLGYQAYKTDRVLLQVDAGVGGVFERNPGTATRSSGAVTAGESFNQRLSGATTITQVVRGLWKTDNFSDSLYTFNIGLTTALFGKSQLKVEFQDTYKHLPPDLQTKKNDTSIVLAIVYKFR